jgi:hypothetical protein
MRNVQIVAMRFERRPGCVERPGRPAQVARDECDLSLGDDAAGAGDQLFRTKRMSSTSQERFRPLEIAKLGHRDSTKRDRSGIAA